MDNIANARAFLGENKDIEVLEAFVIDVNGVPRGKWIPRERAFDVLDKGHGHSALGLCARRLGTRRLCRGLAEGTGDPDGICFPIADFIFARDLAEAANGAGDVGHA